MNVYPRLLLRALNNDARQAAQQMTLARAALRRAADAVDRGPLQLPVRFQADVPVQTSIRIQQTLQVPVQTEIPIKKSLDLPVNTPFGSFTVPVPIDVKVPVNVQVPVTIDQNIPISATLPVQIDRSIEVDLRSTELGAELRRPRTAFDQPP